MLAALGVALSAVVVYLNAFGNDFVLDDIGLIRDNLRIRSLATSSALFRILATGARAAHRRSTVRWCWSATR